MKTNQFAIVVSEFNQEVTDALLQGALARLEELNISKENILIVKVPGAVEIPLAAQLIARRNKHQAIICLGAVIRGETSHYDYVCEQASQGCQRVMLDHSLPVIFGVLTTENEEQAMDRVGGKHGHKGKEAVDAAMVMINLVKELTKESATVIGF